MSHKEQLNFVKECSEHFPKNFNNVNVLEIGSLNINGTVRQFFNNCNYIGIDIGKGKDVDIVCEGHKYDAESESIDTLISCECFEHNPYWIETFQNMIRMCKTNGLIIMTCATTGRAEHGTTRTTPSSSPLTISAGWEYYKNLTEQDFTENFNISELFSEFKFDHNPTSFDLYFYGVKK